MQDYRKLSIILPAYQEGERIGDTIKCWSQFLDSGHPDSELIVVCDGCTDNTASVAKENFVAQKVSLNIIELPKNQGKGAAVREGVEKAQGQIIVFTDSDMSYRPEVLDQFLAKIDAGADIAIAQRAKDESYPGLGRRVLALISRFIVGNLVLPGIRDTQAGFKAFKKDVAKQLFEKQTIKRFLFDLEILVIAKHRGCSIEKVYVQWEDRPGSTVRLFVDTYRSGRDLLLIMLRKFTGHYD